METGASFVLVERPKAPLGAFGQSQVRVGSVVDDRLPDVRGLRELRGKDSNLDSVALCPHRQSRASALYLATGSAKGFCPFCRIRH